eukprot:TRINITY_DN343_c0_g1_i2.p1 TRINITY_DN343_c0_g1~~TRINITY_DN343_c0_g1_i2.p1  ORF type:complete len:648 (+),score=201.14 TRINITY_DN343_c0_g1_i2:34-1944(+)
MTQAAQQGGACAFGCPLGKVTLAQRNSIPDPLEQLLYVLDCCVPSQPDLFALAGLTCNAADPPLLAGSAQTLLPPNSKKLLEENSKVQALRGMFDSSAESPLASEDDPRVIAALLVLYFSAMPHPVIPPKFYFTAMRVGNVGAASGCLRARYRQLRVLLHKLPPIARNITLRLVTFLHATQLDSARLALLFAKYLLRPTMDVLNPTTAAAPVPTQVVHLVQEMIDQAEFLTLTAEEPALEPPLATMPIPPNEFKLVGFAMYKFDSNGAPNVLSFNAGDKIQLLNAHPDDWLEGMLNNATGFVPAGYIDLIPVNPPKNPGPVTGPPPARSPESVSAPQSPMSPTQHHPVAPPKPAKLSQQLHTTTATAAGQQPTQPVPSPPPPHPVANAVSPTCAQQQPPEYEQDTYSAPPSKPPAFLTSPPPEVALQSPPTPTPKGGDSKRSVKDSEQIAISTSMIIVVVGSGAVGKSALTLSFVKNEFIESYDPTIEDSYRKQVTVDDYEVVLDILDTAGQEEFSAMRDKYMRQGDGFLLVFSLTCRQSWGDIPNLHGHILQVKDCDKVPVLLVANKMDLAHMYQVTLEEVTSWAKQHSVPHIATSAKLRVNVDEAFLTLVRLVLKQRLASAPSRGKSRKLCCII